MRQRDRDQYGAHPHPGQRRHTDGAHLPLERRLQAGAWRRAGSSDEVEILISLHGGIDALRIVGTAGADEIRAGTTYNGTFSIGVMNLDATETSGVDWDVAFSGVEYITILGDDGADTLSAGGGAGTGDPLHLPLELRGGDQADTLTGGNSGDRIYGDAGQDVLKGAKGADILYGNDGAGGDYLGGGGGSDTCAADPGDTKVLCEQ